MDINDLIKKKTEEIDSRIQFLSKEMEIELSKDEFDRVNEIQNEINSLNKEKENIHVLCNPSVWC